MSNDPEDIQSTIEMIAEHMETGFLENIAAMLVMLSRHDARSEALIDPMMGSGTIPIEAGCLAQGRGVWVSPRAPAARGGLGCAACGSPTHRGSHG